MNKRYPIGIQTFSEIIKGQWRYVDKTGLVYQLANDYRYVFLNRPRRFGKSLFVSTLHSYFAGEREYFEGLEAGRLEKEWTKHAVLHFDMSTAKHMEAEQLRRHLDFILTNVEREYGVEKVSNDENARLVNLIQCCYEQTGQQVVVLIDEYDAPLLDVLTDDEKLTANCNIMRNFYSPLKACDPYLRFVFITGITKFSQLSIFSELNNLRNISMLPEYAAICGITEEELLTQFSEDVDDVAARRGETREQVVEQLKANYDGYHFSEECPDIYNPFSLITALDAARFEYYWFSSGTPTFLIEQMRRFGTQPQSISEMRARKNDFDVPTEGMTSITPLLYQSGYLTIKGYNPANNSYTLGIPNREVRAGLMECLVPYVAGNQCATPASLLIMDMQEAFYNDDLEALMEGLRTFFASIPYIDSTKKSPESFYQTLLYVVFSMMCQYTDVEVHTPRGRADLVINSRNKVYVVEVKLDKSAAFALDQINLKQYGERFLIEGKPIVKIGVAFDSETRNIGEWTVSEEAK